MVLLFIVSYKEGFHQQTTWCQPWLCLIKICVSYFPRVQNHCPLHGQGVLYCKSELLALWGFPPFSRGNRSSNLWKANSLIFSLKIPKVLGYKLCCSESLVKLLNFGSPSLLLFFDSLSKFLRVEIELLFLLEASPPF